MRLVYYRTHVPNFGDDLNADIWPALAPALFADPDARQGFLGIGTVIGRDFGAFERLHVFSSGVGNDPIANWAGQDVRYHCVRGPVSARMLGLDDAAAITDGAILAPLVETLGPAGATGGGGTVVIPHFQTLAFPGWDEVMARTGFTLADPRLPPADVLTKIASADLVLTESLHGAILADTYGIPWIAFLCSRNFGVSKWIDWTASLGLPCEVTLVPPPDPQPLFAFGRRHESFGTTLCFDMADAFAEFDRRVTPHVPRTWIREQLTRMRPLWPLMGFTPRRTATALTALAAGRPHLSTASLRDGLRDRLLTRLKAVSAQYA